MVEKESKKDRAEGVVQDLIASGWSVVMVGTMTIYQKPAPIVEPTEFKRKAPKNRRRGFWRYFRGV